MNNTIVKTPSIAGIISFVVGLTIVLLIVISLFFILFGIYLWITSSKEIIKYKKGKRLIITGIVILILIILGVALLNFILTYLVIGDDPGGGFNLPVLTFTPTPISNLKTYSDPQYHFSFQYPSNWTYNSVSDLNQSGVDATGKILYSDTHTLFFNISGDPEKPTLRFEIILHSNNNHINLNQFINQETYGHGMTYLGNTEVFTIDDATAVEGGKPPDTIDVYTILSTLNFQKSFLVEFILYGNGGALNGGAGYGTPPPTLDLYSPSDPFLQQTIKDVGTMLSTFKFTQ